MVKAIALGLLLCLTVCFLPWTALSSPVESVNIPKFSKPPKIDGTLDNPLWEEQALKIEDFIQFAPKEKGAPTQKTVAYAGYDQKNLYIAFRCYDSEPEKIRASITNRDNIIDDDWVAVFVDTFNEKRRAFSFIINPLGVQFDAIRTEEGGNDRMDESWDTVFYSDGKMDDGGFTVEMAIPFKSIRFPDEENKVWNLFLGR
ncbi:MAG: carbohydrate binding family 9 domain-containing protein, partial [Candidatus Aminicenantes bacterium]|nr:carbohydrate binding family 9 domain-containing protein [Candidatus Aminicenantes bacterium]